MFQIPRKIRHFIKDTVNYSLTKQLRLTTWSWIRGGSSRNIVSDYEICSLQPYLSASLCTGHGYVKEGEYHLLDENCSQGWRSICWHWNGDEDPLISSSKSIKSASALAEKLWPEVWKLKPTEWMRSLGFMQRLTDNDEHRETLLHTEWHNLAACKRNESAVYDNINPLRFWRRNYEMKLICIRYVYAAEFLIRF